MCSSDLKFFNSIIDYNEKLLPPTPFIQSTFNTIGAQIALLTSNNSYNNTYVHRGISFESALVDAMLQIKEENATVLVGAMDEMNPTVRDILTRLGWAKDYHIGEGAVFFTLSADKRNINDIEIADIDFFNGTGTPDDVSHRIHLFAKRNNLDNYHLFTPSDYKSHCGEYTTASAFGLWYALQEMKRKNIRHGIVYNHFLKNHSLTLLCL